MTRFTAFDGMCSGAQATARWAAIALGFSIPISVALDSVLLTLALGGWLAGGMYREKLAIFVRNPVALSAVALFGVLVLGLLYGDRNPGDGALYLRKYLDLLFIPILIFLFRDVAARRYALHAFAISLTLVLVLSYLIKFGVVPANRFLLGDPANPVVVKQYLSHGLLMAYGAFLFAQFAHAAASIRMRWCWRALAALAAINVTLMIQGRTGYAVLAVLVLYWGYSRMRWRGLAISLASVIALAGLLAAVPGPFQQRVALMMKEAAEWRSGQAIQTSVGFRLEFYRNSVAMIAEQPLFGFGTGSFPKAYERAVRGTAAAPSRNPHNEYLHIAVQTGLLGLLLMLNLFFQQWRTSRRLASRMDCDLARGVVLLMITGCLFNSMLTDHGEGILFAWLTGVLYGGLRPARGQERLAAGSAT